MKDFLKRVNGRVTPEGIDEINFEVGWLVGTVNGRGRGRTNQR